jgi:hypothetical protein
MHTHNTHPVVPDRAISFDPFDDDPQSALATLRGLRRVCVTFFDTFPLRVALITDPASFSLGALDCLRVLSGGRVVPTSHLAHGLAVRSRDEETDHLRRTRALGFCRDGAPTAGTLFECALKGGTGQRVDASPPERPGRAVWQRDLGK